MKTKLVNRYYCDFCKKAGGSSGHIRRHEASCTLNPNRVCRMCQMIFTADKETVQKPIGELLALLPGWCEPDTEGPGGWLDLHDSSTAIVALRAATKCPACILAAIRQKGIPVAAVSGFDFSKEMQAAFDRINEAKDYGRPWPYDV